MSRLCRRCDGEVEKLRSASGRSIKIDYGVKRERNVKDYEHKVNLNSANVFFGEGGNLTKTT